MSEPLKIAIAGLGTVGAGLITLLNANADAITARCGRELRITAVSARDRTKDRGIDLSGLEWYDDAAKLAVEADADIIVEMIGGSEGIALDTCMNALKAGRSVVTANKALVAHHGMEMARIAEENNVSVLFEAAVAGGIPIIKSLREGLAGNSVSRISGILNGTSNYIMTRMRNESLDFESVLKDAQDLGYAEVDPSFDIDGVDAAHKLSILASLAFGAQINFDDVYIEGIREVSLMDVQFADELGYRIKLLGIAQRTENGIEQRVHPCMVPVASAIANIEYAINAVEVECDFASTIVHAGPGAGAGPTASAVMADIMDIARDNIVPLFGVPCDKLDAIPTVHMDEHHGEYYVRLMVVDRSGVFAEIATILQNHDVSMESVLQRGRAPGEPVPLVMVLHETREADMKAAIKEISALDSVDGDPHMIRIELLHG
ncbi:MAG: homoserine dehydrogenase [Rhodospirillales bacterium]|jgi:homoserine dehydrogenase|nr:homoserine dehydrogenase [Rhodospirillales bacterium]